MAKIYISSTFSDLEEFRAAVYKALRRMRHDVIAMEDYVAADDRPLDKCLKDVTNSDLYIGIFAWRYGFVPEEDNPEKKSITELEYRTALQKNKHTLIFLLEKNAPFSPMMMDVVTGENGRGERIQALKEELTLQKTISFFETRSDKTTSDLVEKVIAAVNIWEREQFGEGSHTQYAHNRQRYLEKLYDLYRTVKLPIGPPDGLSLQAIFQPLRLRSNPLAAEDRERKKRRSVPGETLLIEDDRGRITPRTGQEQQNDVQNQLPQHMIANTGDEAIEKSPLQRIVIMGGPGTGKTTTLKYLIGERAKNALADPDAPLPIFLSLDDYARSKKTLQQYFIHLGEEMEAESSYGSIMWDAVQAGKAFLCLDSLDEVKPNLRPKVIEQINGRAANKGNTWVIGTRFTEYKGGQFTRGQFDEWELLSMTHELRLELAERLLPELQKHLPYVCTALSVEAFVKILEEHPRAAAWGETPLLFSLAAVVFLTIEHLPPSRAILYREVVEAILKTRNLDQFEVVLLKRVLSDFALWLYQKQGRTFSKDDLLTFLWDQQHKSWEECRDIAHRISSTGIIEVVARETYVFRHQTFQEYLAAVDIARRLTNSNPVQQQRAWDLAWSKRTYSRWSEILRLMVGILTQSPVSTGRSIAQRWLKALLEQRQKPEGDPGNLNLALALASLGEVSILEEWSSTYAENLEQEAVTIWYEELVLAARYQRYAKVERLVGLAHDIKLLKEPTQRMAYQYLNNALKDRSGHVRATVMQALGKLSDQISLSLMVTVLQDDDYSVTLAAQEVLNKQTNCSLQSSLLTHENSRIRSAAVRALGEQGERVEIGVLLKMLEDEASNVRSAAVEALGKQGERVEIGVLLQALEDEASNVRSSAIEALGERVEIAVFIKALEDEDSDVRSAAVRALGKQGERVEVGVLLQALEDEASNVRSAAIEALGEQGERVEIAVFIKALEDEDSDVRWTVVEALEKQGERVEVEVLLQALGDEDSNVRSAAVEVLGKQGERVEIGVLLKALDDFDIDVRQSVTKILREQEISVLLENVLLVLNNGNSTVRGVAVEILGRQGERVEVEVLLKVLEDEDAYVRSAAIEALGEQGERVEIAVFIKALEDEDSDVRWTAVKALGEQGERVEIGVLLQVLEDEHSIVRSAAVEALGEQGERVEVGVLLQALEDKAFNVRRAAIEALGEQGERVEVEVLLKALEDENAYVRSAAVRALGKQGERVEVEVLFQALGDEDSDVRSAVMEALGKQGERVEVEVLLKALEDENAYVRSAAVEALSKQGERVEVEVLLQALGDEDSNVRSAAVRALGKRGERVEVEVLLKALEDENAYVRSAAVEALSKQGERVEVEVLLKALGDEDWYVRSTAVRALGKRGEQVEVEVLLKALEDEYSEVRGAAVKALTDRSNLSYETLLLMLGDDSGKVRKETGLLFKRMAPEFLVQVEAEARDILTTRIHGRILGSIAQDFVAEVIGNLEVSSPVLLEHLVPLLDWPYWQVQVKAIQAFGKIRRNIDDSIIERLLEKQHSSVQAVARAADDALAEILSIEGIEDA